MYAEGPKPRAFLIVLAVPLIVVALGLLFPAPSGHGRNRKQEAKIASVQLAAALKQYLTEYGRWPAATENGLYLDIQQNAALIRVLRGPDATLNARHIPFFKSARAVREGGRMVGGLDPQTGALLDPWGNPYRIALDANYDDLVPSPYLGDEKSLRQAVIVWSLGKDGRSGAPQQEGTYIGSDDVTSWK